MEKSVFCIAKNIQQANQIVDQLLSAGFTKDDISFLASDLEGKFKQTNLGNATSSSKVTGSDLGFEKHTKAPEGAATGATTGGIIGGTIGLLAGIGSLAIPGIGPFIAAGPIMAALAGSGIGGVVGLITGALVGSGLPEYEAKNFEKRLKEQPENVLIAVHAFSSEEVNQIKEVMKRNEAEDISTSIETASASCDRKADRK